MTTKFWRLGVIVGGFMVLLGLGGVLAQSRGARSDRQPPHPSTASSPANRPSAITCRCATGKTALEILKQRAVVDVRGTSTAPYIAGVNGYRADAAHHEYWSLLVNGSAAEVNGSHYICQGDEELTWKIATY